MFKINNKDTRTTSTVSRVFTVNFEHISHLFLVFLLLTLNRKMFVGCHLPFIIFINIAVHISEPVTRHRPIPEPKPGWNCPACTFLNLPTIPSCDQCLNDRPEDYVVPEGYKLTDRELNIIRNQEEQEKLYEEVSCFWIDMTVLKFLSILMTLSRLSVSFYSCVALVCLLLFLHTY